MQIVICGLGSMGKRRIRLLRTIYPEFDLIGIDTNEQRMNDVTHSFNIPCVASLQDAFEQYSPDAAFICTSPESHHILIQECLMNNIDVFSEINLVSDQYDALIQIAKEKERLLFLSSTPLYRDEIQTIQTAVQSNRTPIHYIYHVGQYLPDWHPWESYQDFFVHNQRTNGCREIFAIELPWMIHTFGEITQTFVQKAKNSSLKLDYYDTYLVTVVHKNGTMGIFCVDLLCRTPVRKLEIYSEQLHVFWDGTPDSLRLWNPKTNKMENHLSSQEIQQHPDYAKTIVENAYENEIIDFIDCLQNNKKPRYSFEEDASILHIIDQIEELET